MKLRWCAALTLALALVFGLFSCGKRPPEQPTMPGGAEIIPAGEEELTINLPDGLTTDVPDTLKAGANTLEIAVSEGTEQCWAFDGGVLTFSGIDADTVCAVSGVFDGNIVIDAGEGHDFELELRGVTLYSDVGCPITVLSGDKVKLTAKKGSENFIYDTRDALADGDTAHKAAVYSAVDLKIGGKGALTVISENNNGIHSSKDVAVDNLSLTVVCLDNAIKGNDSVTVSGGNTVLIAKSGDGIKTEDTDVSKKGNQRGTVTVDGGSLTVLAASDAVDAAYDAVIGGDAVVNIMTGKYSGYSDDTADTQEIGDDPGQMPGGMGGDFPGEMPDGQGQNPGVMPDGQGQNPGGMPDGQGQNPGGMTEGHAQNPGGMPGDRGGFGGKGDPGGRGGFDVPGGFGDGNTEKNDESEKGIKAGNEIRISGGSVTVKSYDDAIHASCGTAFENGEVGTGDVIISGGTIVLYSSDDAIYADGSLSVSGGEISVLYCYEGLEGSTVSITGGGVSVVSRDDGINSTAETGTGVIIGGGDVYIYAGGDGIDSNSRDRYSGIVFDGGNVVVISTSSGNSSIDTENGYSFTGGSVLAVCPSGSMTNEVTMCRDFASYAVKAKMTLKSGQTVTVTGGGNVLASADMPCGMSAFVVYLGAHDAEIAAE